MEIKPVKSCPGRKTFLNLPSFSEGCLLLLLVFMNAAYHLKGVRGQDVILILPFYVDRDFL